VGSLETSVDDGRAIEYNPSSARRTSIFPGRRPKPSARHARARADGKGSALKGHEGCWDGIQRQVEPGRDRLWQEYDKRSLRSVSERHRNGKDGEDVSRGLLEGLME
jgi:hypothetical protein